MEGFGLVAVDHERLLSGNASRPGMFDHAIALVPAITAGALGDSGWWPPDSTPCWSTS
jgi:hypothetical protein